MLTRTLPSSIATRDLPQFGAGETSVNRYSYDGTYQRQNLIVGTAITGLSVLC